MIDALINYMKENTINLVTSNINKLTEYKDILSKLGTRYNIECKKGLDIPEVDGTPLEVIIYKSIDNGANTICEDTSLDVEGEDIGVNIRWLLSDIKNHVGKKAIFKVLIGYNNGKNIRVFEGIIEGVLCDPRGYSNFGFDRYFEINGKTLSEWYDENNKYLYNPRNIALENLIKNKYIYKNTISKIPKWKGSYQNH